MSPLTVNRRMKPHQNSSKKAIAAVSVRFIGTPVPAALPLNPLPFTLATPLINSF